jgi:peptidoglycan/xylan/chitin deacetylase (PgdA/CDA1 family)
MADHDAKVCLTFDFDAISVWPGALGLTSPSAVSRREFSGRVAVPRVLDILKRAGVSATFFVPGITIEAWPDLCRRILDEGHELGHHGYHHITPATMDEAAEREQLERGLATMDRVLDGHRAVGYRSPGGELSANSTRLLAESGFIYESTMSAQDFEPYQQNYTGDAGRKRVRISSINLRDRDGLHGRLDGVRCPVLRMHGTEDPVYSVVNAEDETKLFVNSPGAELRVVEGGQHFLSASNPDDVNPAIAEFINRWT